MKVVTMRHFTRFVKDLDAPVEVTIQEKGTGQVRTLGTWTPHAVKGNVDPADLIIKENPVRPAPKPTKR